MSGFLLGVNTCFAVKRWPRPVDWAPLVRDDLGLALVQHSLDLVDLDASAAEVAVQARDVARVCDAYGLQLHSTFTGLAAYSSNLLLHPDADARRRALRWYWRAIDFTAAAGATATGGHVGAFSVSDWRNPTRRADLLAALVDDLATLAAHAKEEGLTELYVENLAVAREPSTLAHIGEVLREGDATHVPVRLCLDVGHQCVPGTVGAERDPYEWLRRFGAAAPVVQLQQSDADADHHWPFTAKTNAVGRIHAPDVLGALGESGATGTALVLEVIPAFEADDDAVLAEMVESAAYWRAYLTD